jgi:DNA ligase-associated metallophosphoesterase
MVPFSFCSVDLRILTEGAVYCPSRRALLLADLHLEKASCYALHGQMLPPYDSLETLERVGALIELLRPDEVYCLGDSFHDRGGVDRLDGSARDLLLQLTGRVDWAWVIGNHDPEISDPLGGRVVAEGRLGDIVLRHAADLGDARPEMSGHFHPKYHVRVRGRRVSRRCFVAGRTKLILPSFGALTGGMDAADPAILRAVGRDARALVALPERLLDFPLAA